MPLNKNSKMIPVKIKLFFEFVSVLFILIFLGLADPFFINKTSAQFATSRDWIGIYPISASSSPKPANLPGGFPQWMYVNCTQSPTVIDDTGECNFKMPSVLGDYQFRLFANDSFTELVSTNVTVSAAGQTGTCQTNDRASGLISTTGQGASSKFGNATGNCVIDPKAAFVPFRIPTYDELKSLYYTQSKVTNKNTIADGGNIPGSFSQDGLYYSSGTINVSGAKTGSGVEVIFADGDLNINQNILYPDAVTTGPSIPSGLIAYWNMDQTSGPTATDTSGNGFNATIGGTNSFGAGRYANGLTNTGGGVGASFTAGAGSALDFTSSSRPSFTFWFKTSTPNQTTRFIEAVAGGGIGLEIIGGNLRIITFGGSTGNFGYTMPTDGNWHHYAITYDGANARLYVDGGLNTTIGFVGGWTAGAKPFYILGDSSYPTTGSIDDLRIYNRQLNVSEISTIMTTPTTVISGAGTGTLIFIAKGNINIAPTVTQLDAVLISEGIICTSTPSSGPCIGFTDPAVTQRLTVNGSLVSINKIDTTPIRFRRNLVDNTQPAEVVNHQAKNLVIIKNLLSNTLSFNTEF